MSVSMRINGVRQAKKRFEDVADRTENLMAVWPRVGSYISRQVAMQFTSEGKRFGTPWKPLSPKYKLWKLRNGFGRKTLVKTGAMKRKFVGRPMDIEVYKPQTAEFGVSDQKAVWQHYGTHRNGKRAIPPRKILVATREMRGDVRDMIADHIMGRR